MWEKDLDGLLDHGSHQMQSSVATFIAQRVLQTVDVIAHRPEAFRRYCFNRWVQFNQKWSSEERKQCIGNHRSFSKMMGKSIRVPLIHFTMFVNRGDRNVIMVQKVRESSIITREGRDRHKIVHRIRKINWNWPKNRYGIARFSPIHNVLQPLCKETFFVNHHERVITNIMLNS